MTRLRAAFGSVVFLFVAPGLVLVAVPWLLTGFDAHDTFWLWRAIGAVLVAAGLPVLLMAYVRFVWDGLGTPAPVAPPQHLVVAGFYRYVRNPMYLAVGSMLVGEALLLGRPVLFVEAALFAVTSVLFVRLYEEPGLVRRFGDEYEAYRRTVPRWVPRPTGRHAGS